MIIIFKFFPKPYIAMAIWPFIFIRDKSIKVNSTLLNHEKIHFSQQIEMLWFPFFFWYSIEFLIRFILLRNWDKAYRAISFEKEAYNNQTDENYLKNKKFWSFLKYL